jgi:hypothetical protein
MVKLTYNDDVYEIQRASTPDGAIVELNAAEGRYKQLPQPLLEAIWHDEKNQAVFIAYAKGVEIPFEVVEVFIREACIWLPPSLDSPSS